MTINPRTYGSTLWCAYSNRYPDIDDLDRAHDGRIKHGFVMAVNENLASLAGMNSLGQYRESVIASLNSHMPTGFTFPGDASFDSLNEAYEATKHLTDMNVKPDSADFGPGWSNDDLFNDVWRWTQDTTRPMPDGIVDSNDPIDRFIAAVNENAGRAIIPGRGVMHIGTRPEVKRRIALFLEEKVRVGWDTPAMPRVILDACYTATRSNPSGARIDEGDIVKVVYVPTGDESIRVLRWENGEWTKNGMSPWYVQREHLSLLTVPNPETDIAIAPDIEVGTIIRITQANANMAAVSVGDLGTVQSLNLYPDGGLRSVRVTMHDDARSPGAMYYISPDNYEIATDEPKTEPVVAPVDEAPAVDMAEVASLRDRITRLSAENERLRTWQNNAVSDVEKASQELIAQANRRGWCSEYDEIIDGINGMMTVVSFDEREQEYEVEVEWTATVRGTTTVTVTARSAQAAVEEVEEDPASYMDSDSDLVVNEARYNGVDDMEIDSVSVA